MAATSSSIETVPSMQPQMTKASMFETTLSSLKRMNKRQVSIIMIWAYNDSIDDRY